MTAVGAAQTSKQPQKETFISPCELLQNTARGNEVKLQYKMETITKSNMIVYSYILSLGDEIYTSRQQKTGELAKFEVTSKALLYTRYPVPVEKNVVPSELREPENVNPIILVSRISRKNRALRKYRIKTVGRGGRFISSVFAKDKFYISEERESKMTAMREAVQNAFFGTRYCVPCKPRDLNSLNPVILVEQIAKKNEVVHRFEVQLIEKSDGVAYISHLSLGDEGHVSEEKGSEDAAKRDAAKKALSCTSYLKPPQVPVRKRNDTIIRRKIKHSKVEEINKLDEMSEFETLNKLNEMKSYIKDELNVHFVDC